MVNTLWFGRIKEKYPKASVQDNMWVYGSEVGMLRWLAKRNDLELDGNWFQLKTEKLMTFDFNKGCDEPEFEDLKYHKPVAQPYTVNDRRAYRHAAGVAHGGQVYDPVSEATNGKMKKNERINMWVEQYVPYESNKERGMILGFVTEDPWSNVVVHGAEKKDWGVYQEQAKAGHPWLLLPDGEYSVCLSGAVRSRGREEGHLLGDITTFKMEEDYDKQKEEAKGKPEKVVELEDHRPPKKQAPNMVKGPSGFSIPIESWTKMTDKGCSHCQDNLFPEDHESIVWFDRESPLCPRCAPEYGIGKSLH